MDGMGKMEQFAEFSSVQYRYKSSCLVESCETLGKRCDWIEVKEEIGGSDW